MKRIILGLIVLIFCVYSLSIKINAQEKILDFYKENGIEYLGTKLEYNFNCRSKINLEGVKNRILSNLNFKPVKEKRGKDFIEIQFKDSNLKISINDMQLLNIFYSQQSKDMNIIDNIRRSISRLDLSPKRPSFYSLMEGKLKNSLNNEEKKVLARKILKSLYGNEINMVEGDRYISLIGYSNCFNNYLRTDGITFNVNIAIRDGSDGCTYILIGNPIITVEY